MQISIIFLVGCEYLEEHLPNAIGSWGLRFLVLHQHDKWDKAFSRAACAAALPHAEGLGRRNLPEWEKEHFAVMQRYPTCKSQSRLITYPVCSFQLLQEP